MMLQGVKASGAVKGRLLVMSLEQSYRNPSWVQDVYAADSLIQKNTPHEHPTGA